MLALEAIQVQNWHGLLGDSAGQCYRRTPAVPPDSMSLQPHLLLMVSAHELSRFSSSFLFNLLLIYTFDICIGQPCGLLPSEPL